MDIEKVQLCRDCRFCKLTAKSRRISFRCIVLSAPCYRVGQTCRQFRTVNDKNAHQIIAYAWDLVEYVPHGDMVKD